MSLQKIFPFDEEKLSRKLRWRFREWYPHCCSDCSLNGFYPIYELDYDTAALAIPEDFSGSIIEKGSSSIDQNLAFDEIEQDSWMDGLPDHIFMHILQYVHPVELVRNISLVSKRWNRFTQSCELWSEMRVVISGNPHKRKSLTAFLNKVSKRIEKLSIHISSDDFTQRQFINIFPWIMPSVIELDIGFFKACLTIAIIRCFIRCFPNLERFNMEGVRKVSPGVFHELFLDHSFPKLRQLILSHCVSMESRDFLELCASNHSLEVLSVDGIPSLKNIGGCMSTSSLFSLTLTRLYMDGEILCDYDFLSISKCKNLVVFSVSFCETASDLALKHLKNLDNLEHLHLLKGKEFTMEGLKMFFHLPESGSSTSIGFPSRLKYLNMGECTSLNDVVLEVITRSCPNLESLCIMWCWSVTDVGLQMIVQRLNDLRFLDICGLDCIDGQLFFEIPDLYLSKLRYIGVDQCPRIDDSSLQMLLLRKRDLIIRNYYSHFITFSIENGEACFSECYDPFLLKLVADELSKIKGFCCISDFR